MSSFSGGRGRGRGGSSGRGGHGHSNPPATASQQPRLRPCKHYTSTSNCSNPKCGFAHVVKMHASIKASSRRQHQQHQQFGSNNGGGTSNFHPVSCVAVWETPQNTIKIFSGSFDGYWRLWNTDGGNFVKEFEHNMGGGKVERVEVAANFLFCGFEGASVKLPDNTVGMIHAWNLTQPSAPPLEFHMSPLAPYAHSRDVSCLLAATEPIVSGSRDATIRLWRMDPTVNAGKGGFINDKTLHGHAGEITGLAIVSRAILWSSSTDKSIRLWDLTGGGECKYLITRETKSPQGNIIGHTDVVTDLVSLESEMGAFVLSASLDGTVKAWNGTTGECIMSESHGQGVLCMALTADMKGNPLLLCGLENGNIMIRNVFQTPSAPAFCLLMTLSAKYTCGHEGGPVRCIKAGPASTFYSGGSDGKLNVWQITGDFGI